MASAFGAPRHCGAPVSLMHCAGPLRRRGVREALGDTGVSFQTQGATGSDGVMTVEGWAGLNAPRATRYLYTTHTLVYLLPCEMPVPRSGGKSGASPASN